MGEDEEAVKKLNSLDASAGEYMRPSIEKVTEFLKDTGVDIKACDEIEDNYEAVILRFFEGDVPMMTCSGDTVSDEGSIFLDMSNLQFSVNKDSSNLDMANEFMRFLVTSQELNEMAQNKGLVSPTKDLSFISMYAAFGEVPESRIFSPGEIGITDDAVIQFRQAVYGVATGKMTIDKAVEGYDSYTN
ncbi:MAG: hypothetical protein K6F55_09575 [Eubacterium sp.]|nr:hypothetical protein [Eubacterium sp.]